MVALDGPPSGDFQDVRVSLWPMNKPNFYVFLTPPLKKIKIKNSLYPDPCFGVLLLMIF